MPETLKNPTHQLDALLTAQKYFAKDHRHCHPRVLCISTISIMYRVIWKVAGMFC